MHLLGLVYEKLFDFLDKFYVKVSSYVNETEAFKEIEQLKRQFGKPGGEGDS